MFIPTNIPLCLTAAYAFATTPRFKDTTWLLCQNVDPSIQLMTANGLGVLQQAPPGLKISCVISPELG